MKGFLTVFALVALSGCSLFIENTLENKYDANIQKDAFCTNVQLSCMHPDEYNEWQTPAGDVRCQCQKVD